VTESDPELILHINAFACATGWLHRLMTVGQATASSFAVVRLATSRWRRPVTIDPQLASIP
jgi:hypothetical protein